MHSLLAVDRNLEELARVLADSRIVGIPPKNITVVANPREGADVMQPLLELGRKPSSLVLFYFAGHGLLDDQGQLYFGLSRSIRHGAEYSALSASLVQRALARSKAQTRILIVDCCFSGRTAEVMSAPQTVIDNQLEYEGVVTMASCPPNALALAPRRHRYTAFTGELLKTLRNGLPNHKGQFLTVEQLFSHTRNGSLAAGYPDPRILNTGAAHRTRFALNVAYTKPAPRQGRSVAAEARVARERLTLEQQAAALEDSYRSRLEVRAHNNDRHAILTLLLLEVFDRSGYMVNLPPESVILLDFEGKANKNDPWYADEVRLVYEPSVPEREGDDWRRKPDTLDEAYFFDLLNLAATEGLSTYYLVVADRPSSCDWPILREDMPELQVKQHPDLRDSPCDINIFVNVSGLSDIERMRALFVEAREVFRRDCDRWVQILRLAGRGSPAWDE